MEVPEPAPSELLAQAVDGRASSGAMSWNRRHDCSAGGTCPGRECSQRLPLGGRDEYAEVADLGSK